MKRNLSPLKIIYRTLTAILSAYWIFFAVGFSFNCVSRVYLYPLKHKDYVFDSANYYGLDPLLIFSVIKVESDFDLNAKSNAGAIGLMQITSDTGKYVADMQGIVNYDLSNAKTNIEFGCFYLKYLILKIVNKKRMVEKPSFFGDPSGNRTPDTMIKSHVLCQLS